MVRKIDINNDKDINSVKDIYNYYVKNSLATLEETEVSFEDYKKRIENVLEKYFFLVYEENNEILGFSYLDIYNFRSGYRYDADLSIYVKNGFIRKGIGKELYLKTEQLAKEIGIKKIVSIITGLNIKSLNFHESLGFHEFGMLKNAAIKNNTWVNVVFMDKDIKE